MKSFHQAAQGPLSQWAGNCSQGYEPTFTYAQLQAAVKAERKACAELCKNGWKLGLGAKYQGDVFAEAIEKRDTK